MQSCHEIEIGLPVAMFHHPCGSVENLEVWSRNPFLKLFLGAQFGMPYGLGRWKNDDATESVQRSLDMKMGITIDTSPDYGIASSHS